MEFVISRNEFFKCVSRIQGIVEKKSSMAILSNILIKSISNKLISVAASDLEISIIGLYQCNVVSPGNITTNGKNLYNILSTLPKENDVSFKMIENNMIKLKSGRAEYTIPGLPTEEFPKITEDLEGEYFNIKGHELNKLIDDTIFSVSNDLSRNNINGIFFQRVSNDEIIMVSTDGHRLSKSVLAVQTPSDSIFNLGVLIPKKGLIELKKLMTVQDEVIKFGFLKNCIVFNFPELKLIVRLIDAIFPEYQTVIPQESEKVLKLDRREFINVLKRVSTVASMKNYGVKLELHKNVLKVMANNPETGDAVEEFPLEYTGSEMTIGFNAKYLLEALNVINKDEIVLEMGDEYSAGIFKSDPKSKTLFVIMPIRM